MKAFGAISVEETPRWYYRFEERFSKDTFLKFLKRLVRNNGGRKVFLILDNARWHHARLVKDWVEENKSLVELNFLPPYSPDLNAVESVWRVTKRRGTHNRYFETLQRLFEKLSRTFARFQQSRTLLSGVIRPFLESART